MANNAPIGVFDSGVGGLTVIKELIKLMPGEKLVYFGDTARVPYGSRPPEEITKFTDEILCFLSAQKIKMAVVACNAITSVSLEHIRNNYSFPSVGVNRGIDRAIKLSATKQIGVIGTVATVNSGLHRQEILKRDSDVTFYAVGCPKLVPLIEKGILNGPEIEEAAAEYLLPLKNAGVDTLVLACTHYPFITEVISRIMGEETAIINPAYETAHDVLGILTKSNQLANRECGSVELCFSAGIEQAERMAGYLFDTNSVKFRMINLQDFC